MPEIAIEKAFMDALESALESATGEPCAVGGAWNDERCKSHARVALNIGVPPASFLDYHTKRISISGTLGVAVSRTAPAAERNVAFKAFLDRVRAWQADFADVQATFNSADFTCAGFALQGSPQISSDALVAMSIPYTINGVVAQ